MEGMVEGNKWGLIQRGWIIVLLGRKRKWRKRRLYIQKTYDDFGG